jgi:hypothetical protein
MQIKEVFSRDIDREIKEVIKVDDGHSILGEVEEYVPTQHIADELTKVLEVYQDTINNPSDEINFWVSGFFGSGKSSFAKLLGYLLSDPEIDGTEVSRRFFELNDVPAARALLSTIHSTAPTEAVLLDLNTSPNVLQEGEPIVLPIYRTILNDFGYSTDLRLAELEFELETEKRLESFMEKYEEVYSTHWHSQRHMATAKNRASRVLHELDPDTYPSADSWSNSAEPPVISAKWFAHRCLELLGRRRQGKKRLILVVDEVGVYVSRSVDRMRHLQGLAEECQKTLGSLWLLATSQERLNDVVDSLEGKQIELAKAQDRFPSRGRVDLLPSDIEEVTGKRVLDKTASGAAKIRELLAADRNKLVSSVTLQSQGHQAFSDDDFVRLYPLVPYQLQVLIDAVSARRAQGGAPQTMGGSNRTLIRHAQQLLSSESVGLAEEPVGTLVTLDRSYTLLEDVIPTAWRHEVDQVAATHGSESFEAKTMRVIALCAGTPRVPLSAKNIAVLLHPAIAAEPVDREVRVALQNLVAEDRIREVDDGYALQSPEQKDWEKTRRAIDMRPGDAVRLRKRLLRDAISGLTVSAGRTFKVELVVEGENFGDGDIVLDIREDADLDQLRMNSRMDQPKNRVYWTYRAADDTWDALTEFHRSNEMIERYDNAGQSDAQRILLADERKRHDRAAKAAAQLLGRDITNGTVVFDGNTDAAPDGDLKTAASRVVSNLVDKIFHDIALFAGRFQRADVVKVLKADSLDGLPVEFGPEGLGLFRITASGRELLVDSGPVSAVVTRIKERKQYGEDQNGAQLERHFADPPIGATVEAVQAALAAAVRAGLLEVVSQAARITSAKDSRLEQIFNALPKFRSASFRIADEGAIDIDKRAEVSEWLARISGEPVSLDLHELADRGRHLFSPLRQPCTEARATLIGGGLAVPDVLTTMDELLGRVLSSDDELVVSTMHERATDLEGGRLAVDQIAKLVEVEMGTLRTAVDVVGVSANLTDVTASQSANELSELLKRARYQEDLAQIKSLTTKLEDRASAEVETLRVSINSESSQVISQLRSRYPNIGDVQFEEAAADLRALSGPSDLQVLRANRNAIDSLQSRASDALDVLSTTREVRHVKASEIWSGPITSDDDLKAALARLREAVLAQLNDQTEVRFR